jgi:hypothetical protein
MGEICVSLNGRCSRLAQPHADRASAVFVGSLTCCCTCCVARAAAVLVLLAVRCWHGLLPWRWGYCVCVACGTDSRRWGC